MNVAHQRVQRVSQSTRAREARKPVSLTRKAKPNAKAGSCRSVQTTSQAKRRRSSSLGKSAQVDQPTPSQSQATPSTSKATPLRNRAPFTADHKPPKYGKEKKKSRITRLLHNRKWMKGSRLKEALLFGRKKKRYEAWNPPPQSDHRQKTSAEKPGVSDAPVTNYIKPEVEPSDASKTDVYTAALHRRRGKPAAIGSSPRVSCVSADSGDSSEEKDESDHSEDDSENQSEQKDSSVDSSDDEERLQEAKSSTWLDFQAMADRINTTVQKTSTSIKRIADSSTVHKIVDGIVKEKIPKGDAGAWDNVDSSEPPDAEPEFEDQYDPAAEADIVGKAFGDYKSSNKVTAVSREFEDKYEPAVDTTDPLADAFGDGFRSTKPPEVSTMFDDDFGANTSMAEISSANPDKVSENKELGKTASKGPGRPPHIVQKSKESSASQARTVTTKTLNNDKPNSSDKPSKPSKPPAIKVASRSSESPAEPTKHPTIVKSSKPKASSKSAAEGDLHGSQVDSSRDNSVQPPQNDIMTNLDLLITLSGEEQTSHTIDKGQKSVSSITSRLIEGVTSADPPRSESAELLDAFSFFHPDAVHKSVPSKVSNLTAPQINIICASVENLSHSEEIYLLDTQNHGTNYPAGVTNGNLSGEDDYCVSAESGEESEESEESSSDDEDDLDFDDIMTRPVASTKVTCKSDVWKESDGGNIGIFQATFSVSGDAEGSSCGGGSTSEYLIDNCGNSNDGSTHKTAIAKAANRNSGGKTELNDSAAVPMKRAMRFARTFSETIDESDDEADKSQLAETELESTGLGLVVNPLEQTRDAADGEVPPEVGSDRHVWIDMTKPMPRLPVLSVKQEKEKKAKSHESTIKLKSQACRAAMQVKTKPIPRPKGRELVANNDDNEASTVLTESKSGRKMVTQGQADHLTLQQLKEATTLTFEISSTHSDRLASALPDGVPILPPPPKTSPAIQRKNPFSARSDNSTDDESSPAQQPLFQSEVDTCIQNTAPPLIVLQPEIMPAANKVEWEVIEKQDLPPLEEFRPRFDGSGWRMLIRKPPKKTLTKKRFWEEVFLRLTADEKDVPCLYLYRNETDAQKGAKELEILRLNPFHQLPDKLYLQQYDAYGKCHTVKVLHVSYKERPGLRTDRVTEALPSFIKGYMRPTKTTIFEHVPTKNELFKFGSLDYKVMRMFIWELEDCLMKQKTERINTNVMYQKNEIIADAWDEYEAIIDREGHIVSHKARVRLFLLCFLSGMPLVELGINDRRRRGKEVVRRHEIIPVKAENWITVEGVELHHVVRQKEWEENGIITFYPLDACKFEFMRFRYRPKKNRELPLQIGVKMAVDREKRFIELRADLLIPGYFSNSKRKGQVPCEDIQVCFPIPEAWIYKFRVEKNQKYGSLHATTRKPGKVKGLERITSAFGKAVESYLPPSFIECSVGDAKYEHVYRSVVWRVDKLPRFNEGAYKSHYFALRLSLGAHDPIPDSFEPQVSVEFTMPHTTVSGTAIRSISCSQLEEPPEKWVHHHAKYEYSVEIDFQSEIKELLPTELPYADIGLAAKIKEGKEEHEDLEQAASEASSADERPDSDDTMSENSESEAEDGSTNQLERPEKSGYGTLLDLDGDLEGDISETEEHRPSELSAFRDELLDFSEQTTEQEQPSVQPNILDLL